MVNTIEEIKEKAEQGIEVVEKVAEKVKDKEKKVVKEIKKDIKKILEPEKRHSAKEKKDEKISLETSKDSPNGSEKPEKSTEKTKKLTKEELEKKKKALLEKAKKLKEKIDAPKTEELKEQVKIKKREDMLIPLEEYVRAGIYLGTKVVTPTMKQYVYRKRADGLAIFNTDLIDKKLKQGIEYLSKFDAKDIIVACKREAGWKAVKKFGELTGIKVFTKKYPAGILTNTTLPSFFENKLTIVCDSWLDRNALNDTLKVHKKVLMICDTNNFSKGANQIIIGNNKSGKSLGVIFYILARGFLKAKKLDTSKIPDLDWWTSEEEDKIKKKVRKRF